MKRFFFEFQTLKLEILRGIQTRLLECYMLIKDRKVEVSKNEKFEGRNDFGSNSLNRNDKKRAEGQSY